MDGMEWNGMEWNGVEHGSGPERIDLIGPDLGLGWLHRLGDGRAHMDFR